VGLGAIVVVGAERGGICLAGSRESNRNLLESPLAFVEILGRSTTERMIERFVRADVDAISVLVQTDGTNNSKPLVTYKNAEVQFVKDTTTAIAAKLKEYSRNGLEHSFVVSGSVYAETDLLDLFYFHREARQTATRARDRRGPLELWVVDCLKAQQEDLKALLAKPETTRASYFIREYINRLASVADVRQLATDILRGRTSARPGGKEIKRGIWIDESAEVHKRSRIVAPAYIGRASKVMEDTLITRFTNVEKGCCVDYGTVVENSSILENTHIGICLDVCHAIANGNKLLSLGRNVVVEISDPSVMRFNSPEHKRAKDGKRAMSGFFSRRKVQQMVSLQSASSPAPEQCRLEPNPIQG
jgi:NDP-sugar pyrophosphorylase family protein